MTVLDIHSINVMVITYEINSQQQTGAEINVKPGGVKGNYVDINQDLTSRNYIEVAAIRHIYSPQNFIWY